MPALPTTKPVRAAPPTPVYFLDLTESASNAAKLTDCKAMLLGEDGTVAIIGTFAADPKSPQGGMALLTGQGALRSIARTGVAAPGFAGEKFDKILPDHLSLSDTGQVLFMTTLSHDNGKEKQDRQLWLGGGTSPAFVAAEGRSVSKDAEVVTKIQGASLMRNGLIVLHVLEGTKQQPTRYIGMQKKLTAVALPGEEGAKADARATEFEEPALAGMLPYATAVGSGDTTSAIWIGWNGKFRRVAAAGDPAPGMDGFTFKTFAAPVGSDLRSINIAGQIAFVATAAKDTNERVGVWVMRSGKLELIASAGDAVPGPAAPEPVDATIVKPLDAFIDDDGHLFVYSTLKIKDQQVNGVHMWRGGKAEFVMADGYPLGTEAASPKVSFDFNRKGMHVERIKAQALNGRMERHAPGATVLTDKAMLFDLTVGWDSVLVGASNGAFEEGGVIRPIEDIKWISQPTVQRQFLCRATCDHFLENRMQAIPHDRVFRFQSNPKVKAKTKTKARDDVILH